jgi:hypothetical protein
MNREKILMTAAGLVMGLLILDSAVIAPLTNVWKERAKEIGYLTQDVTKGRQLVSREDSLRDRWTEMQARALPESRSDAESRVLNNVDDWSRSARLKPSRIIPNWRDEQGHAKLSCRMEATGDMEAVMRFIYDLDGEELALRVESFDLASIDKRGRNLALDMTLSGLELPEERER